MSGMYVCAIVAVCMCVCVCVIDTDCSNLRRLTKQKLWIYLFLASWFLQLNDLIKINSMQRIHWQRVSYEMHASRALSACYCVVYAQ